MVRAAVWRLIVGLLASKAVTNGQEENNTAVNNGQEEFNASVTNGQEKFNQTSLLGLDYSQINPPIRPDGSPVKVEISIHILDVKVDEDAQTVQFDCYLRTVWEDHRINMPDVDLLQLDTAVVAKMWVPNSFFVHVQSVTRPKLLSDASGINLYRNKTILHSSLYLTKYTCYLNYKKYPMDNQACNIRLEAYMYSNKTMVLQWHHTGITWEQDIRLKSFILKDIRPVKTEYRKDIFAAYDTAIGFEILLERKVRNSVLSVFVPSSMLIFVSWLSLWVPAELVPGRMVLVITTLLTLTALFNANVQSMPEVSYVKALDVWILTCIVFVFFTIVEYIVVLRLVHGDTGEKVAPQQDAKVAWTKSQKWTGVEKAALLETVSRTLSPVAFFIFNIAYWSYYLSEDIE